MDKDHLALLCASYNFCRAGTEPYWLKCIKGAPADRSGSFIELYQILPQTALKGHQALDSAHFQVFAKFLPDIREPSLWSLRWQVLLALCSFFAFVVMAESSVASSLGSVSLVLKGLQRKQKDYSQKIIIILIILQATRKRKSIRINILRFALVMMWFPDRPQWRLISQELGCFQCGEQNSPEAGDLKRHEEKLQSLGYVDG